MGYSREGGVSVTLRRLSERELRFRLRLDHAQIVSANGSVSGLLKGEGFRRYLDYDFHVQRAMLWALDHGRIHADGGVTYDAWALNRAFPTGSADGMSRDQDR